MPPHLSILHERHQHAIGHGFFHTASVRLVDPRHAFEYIYDVGAKKTKELLTPRLDEYSAALGQRQVDMLVLSHFHHDHTSGLDQLLLRCKVDTVVIPYVYPVEKILLIATRLATGTADASSVGFAVDPSAWLMARGVRRVIVIQPGEPPQGNPDRPERNDPDDQQNAAPAHWRLTKGPPTSQGAGPGEPVPNDILPHQVPLVLGLGLDSIWQFKFFCHHAADHWNSMLPLLADAFQVPAADFNAVVTTTWTLSQLRDQSKRDKLKSVYRKLVGANGMNWTSLCLWSGPAIGRRYLWGSHVYVHGDGQRRSHQHVDEERRVAWLGTGDAPLADQGVADAFVRHFVEEANAYPLASMSLPHHGSRHNHNLALLGELDPALLYVTCPAAKDDPAKQKHPATVVEDQIKKWRGQALLRVDESDTSGVHEWVRLYGPYE